MTDDLPPGSAVRSETVEVSTGTACLTLMDVADVAVVWEDFLYDGHDHDHGGGSLMLNRASVGTHTEYDGHFPVTLHFDADDAVVGLEVQLDPYGVSSDSGRRPAGWTEHDEHDHHHGVPFGTHRDGWSAVSEVLLVSDESVLGDPAALPDADGTGVLLDVRWPGPRGVLRTAVRVEDGTRVLWRAVWSPQ